MPHMSPRQVHTDKVEEQYIDAESDVVACHIVVVPGII